MTVSLLCLLNTITNITKIVIQCATKSVILHLQWTEEGKPEQTTENPVGLEHGTPLSASMNGVGTPPSVFSGRSRQSIAGPLSRSMSSVSAIRRQSLQVSTSGMTSTPPRPPLAGRPSLPLSASVGPGSPLGRSGTPGSPIHAVRSLRAAVLTAPPQLVAVVDTADVAVGAVDPQKRRVVTATRFSSRLGADRRVRVTTYCA